MLGPKIFAGDRLRRLRMQRGLTQAAVAKGLGISASYLNQMERDARPAPPAMRARLATWFVVPETVFADAADEQRAAALLDATADPRLGRGAVSFDEARAAVRAAPGVADRFVALHRAHAALQEQYQALSDQMAASDQPGGAAHFPYDEVRDWVQSRRNFFAPLDRAAERLAERARFAPATLAEDLTRHLRDAHRIVVQADPDLLAQGTVWRLQRGAGSLHLAEASVASRVFWMAHIIGQLEQRALIEREVRAARLSTPEARAIARIGLANYFAGALMMPYGHFLAEAQAVRYDLERLQARFGASFEQVCHRLSTMQRPEQPGIPFYFVKTDIAGNVLKRSSATRFRFARFGGPCPLWNVYRAFASPGQILVQLAQTPDRVTYVNIARTVGRSGGYHLARPRNVAVVLGCEVEYASQTVYAAGLDLHSPEAAVPIGPGCRACERVTCRHRAVPPAGQALDVGTGERGVVPYRIRR